MEIWWPAAVLVSLWITVAVGADLARRNWCRLTRGSLVQSGGATLMADEWHLSSDARAALRQAFLILVGLTLVGQGLAFTALSAFTILFG